MTTAIELLRQGRRDEIWEKYCGFINLSLEEFMEIQKRLLLEQLQLLGTCELGRKILGDKIPTSIEEFRKVVPLTTYELYAPYLMNKREDALPRKVHCWACTSGRSGFERKWAPFTKEMATRSTAYVFASFIFGSSERRDEFLLEEGDILLYTLAPPPYASGIVGGPGVLEHFPLRYIPPLEIAEKMSFQERIEEGFKLALKEGIDIFYGLAGVLVRIGEQFEQGARGEISSLLHPKTIFRLGKGLIKSKLARRHIAPRDLWSVKAIMAGGMDVAIFRDRIEEYWGKAPVEIYGGTEILIVAMQTWSDGLTFVPELSFFEFSPEEEHIKSKQDPSYQPRTILLDKVKAGDIYELVVTNFHGGVFTRYRSNDLIKIIALRDDEHDIDIPQMVFYSRADDIIDLMGFARLTEGTIWQAIENAEISYVDWTIRKESREKQPVLHLYIELTEDELRGEEGIREAVHQSFKDLDPNYRDIEKILGLKPLYVTILSPGAFQRYFSEKQAAGVDLAHLKPPHMKPSDKIIGDLLRLGG